MASRLTPTSVTAGLLAGALLVLLVLRAQGLLGGGPPAGGAAGGAPPVPSGGLALEARPQLMGYGGWYGFTVDRAGTLRFSVDLPAGVESTLVWGPPGGEGVRGHLPDPALAERVPVRGGARVTIDRRPRTLGPHVLLLEQVPVTMGDMHMPSRVAVEFVPDHEDCAR